MRVPFLRVRDSNVEMAARATLDSLMVPRWELRAVVVASLHFWWILIFQPHCIGALWIRWQRNWISPGIVYTWGRWAPMYRWKLMGRATLFRARPRSM